MSLVKQAGNTFVMEVDPSIPANVSMPSSQTVQEQISALKQQISDSESNLKAQNGNFWLNIFDIDF